MSTRRLSPFSALCAPCGAALVCCGRGVAGGMGRGDLAYQNFGNQAHRRRSLGVQRGLIHNSQATEPQTGQLYYRKRAMHSSLRGTQAASGALRAPIATWSYLIPSLTTGIEAAVPADIYEKLQAGDGPLAPAAASRLEEGQRMFRYELHQRLPLLEDSLAEAEVAELVAFPLLFKRAWVLPPTSAATASSSGSLPAGMASSSPSLSSRADRDGTALTLGDAVSSTEQERSGIPVPFSALARRRKAAHAELTVGQRASGIAAPTADVTPTANQVFDLDQRVGALLELVHRFAQEELTASGSMDEAAATVTSAATRDTRSRRRQAQHAALQERWREACEWCGW